MQNMSKTLIIAVLLTIVLLNPTAAISQTHLIEDVGGPFTYKWATIGLYTSYEEGGDPENPILGDTNFDVSAVEVIQIYIVLHHIIADDEGVPGQEYLDNIGAFSFKVSWDNTAAAVLVGANHADGINASTELGVFEFGCSNPQNFDDPFGGPDQDHAMVLVTLEMMYIQPVAQPVNFYLEPSPECQVFSERMLVVDGTDYTKILWMRPSSAPVYPDDEFYPDEYDQPVFTFNGQDVPPSIISEIADVANDQGRQVRIEFLASNMDVVDSPSPIIQYEAFRRIESTPVSKANSPVKDNHSHEMISSPEILVDGWEYVGAVPAHCDDVYNMIAPTLVDSTIVDGMHWTTFFLRAATSEPSVYWDSLPDSGYSLDNLAPAIPSGFQVDADMVLSWDVSADEDFNYFTVFGSFVSQLDETAALISHTTITSMDVSSQPFLYYYLTATDFSGNRGQEATIAMTAVPEVALNTFLLWDNIPNPFNPKTTIAYNLPNQTRVNIRIFDITGRLVDVLVEGEVQPAGTHTTTWVGRDSQDRAMPSGTYFYCLEAGGYSETKRMTLIR